MKLENFTDLQTWAVEQWGDVELGDSRRTQRAIAIGAAMAANRSASLPDMMQGWNEIRAAYRLFAAKSKCSIQMDVVSFANVYQGFELTTLLLYL